ncbi:MAG: hypothetical protein GXP04_01025 [Alphaproteobacteria bacterium]|nr:hypothetical protein [Alphaproteobacteria bacterium]
MKILFKTFAAGIAGLFVIGASTAFANDRTSYGSEYGAEYRPEICTVDHDHRSHAANYYNYYPADKYFRAGKYRRSGVSFSITIGDSNYDRYDRRDRRDGYNRYNRNNRYDRYNRRDNHDRYDRRNNQDYGRRNGYRGREGRVVNREVFDTRYRARIVLIEEVVRSRRGPRLVCTVQAKGPEAGYVSKRRMHRIANRVCSSSARIQVYT